MLQALLGVILICGAALPLRAADVPPELQAMRKAFAAAIAKGDPKAADFAVFPLANRVYRQPETLSKERFLREIRLYAKMKECLAGDPIQKADAPGPIGPYLIDCNGNLFYFVLRNGQWRYAGYENINE